MAADQWRKRLSSASVVGYTSRQQHSMKRKKLASPQCDASIASTIVLEWDDTRKSVVAKKEQVGIAQRDLSPFIDAVPSCRNILADIVNVPQGTFDLENLSDVLSFEVNPSCLNSEPIHIIHFLYMLKCAFIFSRSGKLIYLRKREASSLSFCQKGPRLNKLSKTCLREIIFTSGIHL